MARLNAPLFPDGVSMVVIYGRILTGMIFTDATFVYLFTYIKTNTVPLGRCGLRLSVSIKVESQKRGIWLHKPRFGVYPERSEGPAQKVKQFILSFPPQFLIEPDLFTTRLDQFSKFVQSLTPHSMSHKPLITNQPTSQSPHNTSKSQ